VKRSIVRRGLQPNGAPLEGLSVESVQ